MKRFLLLLSLALGGPGCGEVGVQVSETCAHFGDQCRLRDGLLGVCTEDGEGSCESPPCLKCQGQH